MMTMIDGKNVADCFALVSRYGVELEALGDTLENLLSEQLTEDKASLPCVLSGAAEWDDRLGAGNDNAWAYTDRACNLPLKQNGKGRKNIERYLGFQISMTGDGINIPGNAEPLLHVFLWSCPVEFDDEYVGFPLDSDPEYPYKLVDDRLVLWEESEEGGWNKQEWTYSLRLMSINSIEDLEKYVVTPALALLKGENVRDVLPDEWLGKTLIRYPAPL